jgi:hypothetical protein
MRNDLARTMRPAFRVPREGLRRVSSLIYVPGSQTQVSLGIPVTQIEFFFDRHVTGRVSMIRLLNSGCALVVRHRRVPRTFCGLPMQVLGA